ncbi:MAG: hypothetical protein ACRDZT_01190 [Acidimicrobiales bacterium]
MLLGVLLVPIIFLELPRFLPVFGYPGLIDALQWIVIGGLWMLALLVRPRGLIPERRYIAMRGGEPLVGFAPGDGPGLLNRLFMVGRGDEVSVFRRRRASEVPLPAPAPAAGEDDAKRETMEIT